MLLALIAARRGVAWIALAAGVLLQRAQLRQLPRELRRGGRVAVAAAGPPGCMALLAGGGQQEFVLFAGDLWFFLAQRGTRTGQFPPFEWLPGLVRLARCTAGAVLGGLPLYVSGALQTAVAKLRSA